MNKPKLVMENEIMPPRHPKRTDILPVIYSIVHNKSSKLHKLKFRPESRDKTKTNKSKLATVNMMKMRDFDFETEDY